MSDTCPPHKLVHIKTTLKEARWPPFSDLNDYQHWQRLDEFYCANCGEIITHKLEADYNRNKPDWFTK